MKSKNSKINAIKRARAAYRREMVKYYFNEGLTQRQMATELDCSKRVVQEDFKALGLRRYRKEKADNE